MDKLRSAYWEELYRMNRVGWDVGYATYPFTGYCSQLPDKSIRILVPGAGNGHEVEYLFQQGFHNVYLLDYAEHALENFVNRVLEFPKKNIIHEDFFDHQGEYDLILEQTFFCSLLRENRQAYVQKIHELLVEGGKLVGLLFNHEFGWNQPPFGGTEEEYRKLFEGFFQIRKMEIAYNSIKPRKGRELFFILQKPTD